MRQEPNSVEIQDPTIKTLGKKQSCLKRSCVSGLGCIALFVAFIIVLVRVAMGPGPKDINGIPSHFPQDFSLYNVEKIEQTYFVSGKTKNRGFEIAALVPKIILSPIFLTLNPERQLEKSVKSGHVVYKKELSWDDFMNFATTPIGKQTDTVAIEWADLGAEIEFISDFYMNEFGNSGYTYERVARTDEVHKIIFSKGDVRGTLFLEDLDTELRGTDYMTLTVDFPTKK